MNESKIYDLLYQKSEILLKRVNRIFLFLYIFPLIYFLLVNSFISEVKTPLISIDQVEIILLTSPIIYSTLMLLIVVLAGRLGDIHDELFKIDVKIPNYILKTKKLLQPIIFINELIDQKYNKGFLGAIGQIVVYFPLILFITLFPFFFFGYVIYDNFQYSGDFEKLAFWSSIIGLWIITATTIQTIGLIKRSKKNKYNS